ncbi:hypothetical protein ACO1DI_12380 [Priestia sp. 40]|uniref:hypothetical protein n=1 Tax=Priestia sp. 40 TaxID=3394459 RepID=UPI003BF6B7A8
MKLELITQAYNVPNFEEQANQLTSALNSKVLFKTKEDEQLTYIGFKLALDMITDNPNLIQPTLYKTMKQVKKTYSDFSRFTRDYRKMSAISLAVNYLYNINMRHKTYVESQAYAESHSKQYKENERIVMELANDIAQMLGKTAQEVEGTEIKKSKKYEPVKRKPIWALNIQAGSATDTKPFIAGYKQKDVAKVLGVSRGSISSALQDPSRIVGGYRIWKGEAS